MGIDMNLFWRIINWIDKNCHTTWILFLFALSVVPFFRPAWHGNNFYTGVGGMCGFFSMLFCYWYEKDAIKVGQLYKKLSLVVLLLGASAFYFLSGMKTGDHYTSFQLFISTYFGALLGMIFGNVILHKKPWY